MSDNIINLTDESFPRFISSPGVKLVYAKASWCGPCRMISPVVEEISQEWSGKIHVAKLDVDDCPETSVELLIRGVPSIFVFQNGEIISRVSGVHPKNKIVEMFNNLLPSSLEEDVKPV